MWLNGVGMVAEPLGSAGTGQRKSYSRRINRDKLNNCALVRGAAHHSINTDQIQSHMVVCIISLFSSASSWLCSLLDLCECRNVDVHMHMVFVFMYMVYLAYSPFYGNACASWERVVSSVNPPSCHSLSLWWTGPPPPSEGHTWVGSELRDYRVEVGPNSFTADSQRHKSACGVRPGPRSVSGVGDVVGGQTWAQLHPGSLFSC